MDANTADLRRSSPALSPSPYDLLSRGSCGGSMLGVGSLIGEPRSVICNFVNVLTLNNIKDLAGCDRRPEILEE